MLVSGQIRKERLHQRQRQRFQGNNFEKQNSFTKLERDDIQDFLDNLVENNDSLVSVSGAVVSGDEILTYVSGRSTIDISYSYRGGLSIVRNSNEDVTLETQFMLASVSKLITWTALSMLLDAELFELDDDVNDFLPFNCRNPDYKNKPVTFRHLYSHTSGIYDTYIYKYGSKCPTDKPYPTSLEETCEKYASDYNYENWEFFAPGNDFSYSNMATGLAGLLVERISGHSFSDFCDQYIFDPLGMSNTQWWRPSDGSAQNQYEFCPSLNLFNTVEDGYCFADYPSGQLWSTAEDMGKFVQSMMRKGYVSQDTDTTSCLYGPEVGDLVYEKSSPTTGDGDSGLGWFVGEPIYTDGAGHDGGEFGTASDLFVGLGNGYENTGFVWMASGNLDDDLYETLSEKFKGTAQSIGGAIAVSLPSDCERVFST